MIWIRPSDASAQSTRFICSSCRMTVYFEDCEDLAARVERDLRTRGVVVIPNCYELAYAGPWSLAPCDDMGSIKVVTHNPKTCDTIVT